MIINGKESSLNEGTNILQMLESLNLSEDRTVIEVNGEIIAKDDYKNKILHNEDIVEIVGFVGGG